MAVSLRVFLRSQLRLRYLQRVREHLQCVSSTHLLSQQCQGVLPSTDYLQRVRGHLQRGIHRPYNGHISVLQRPVNAPITVATAFATAPSTKASKPLKLRRFTAVIRNTDEAWVRA